MSSIYIIHQSGRSAYTRDGFNRRWSKVKEEVKLKFPEQSLDFTFHDLKAEEVSDPEGGIDEKRAIAGHKNIDHAAENKKPPDGG